MSSLVIIFIVTIATILPNYVVDSKPSRDLEDIVSKHLHQQQHKEVQNRDSDSSDSSDSSSSSDDDSDDRRDSDDNSDTNTDTDGDQNRFARMRSGDVLELIEQATQNKNTPNYKTDHRNKRRDSFKNQLVNLLIPDGRYLQTRVLEQLLSEDVGKMNQKRKDNVNRQKKRLENNRPFISNDDVTGLENYSKIYIVLDPAAVAKSKNKKSLNYLVSKILYPNSESTKKDRQVKNKLPRYKGFLMREDLLSRRARRESKERYALKDSIEDDYKQKWSRNDRNGGGSGRTAIPYIRPRGDIYERDN